MKKKKVWKKVDECDITDEFIILQPGDNKRCVIGGWDLGEPGIYIEVENKN